MKAIPFSGTFRFKNISPEDKEVVRQIVQREFDYYSEKHEYTVWKDPARVLDWQDGDTFRVETSRPTKTFGLFRSNGETVLLDSLIKNALHDENMARRREKEKAATEGKPCNKDKIPFSYSRLYTVK